jgi:hypothetical protein
LNGRAIMTVFFPWEKSVANLLAGHPGIGERSTLVLDNRSQGKDYKTISFAIILPKMLLKCHALREPRKLAASCRAWAEGKNAGCEGPCCPGYADLMVVTGPESVVGRLRHSTRLTGAAAPTSGKSRRHSFFDDVNVHRGYGRICAIKDALTPGPSRWCRDHVLSLSPSRRCAVSAFWFGLAHMPGSAGLTLSRLEPYDPGRPDHQPPSIIPISSECAFLGVI